MSDGKAVAVRRDATPVEADQWEADALAAISSVATPDDAEALLRRIRLAEQAIQLSRLGAAYEQRWGRVRLMGERRYGELLGPAEHGGDRKSESSSSLELDSAERHERNRARKLYEVPEPVFTEYVDTAEHPSRAELLRKAASLTFGEPEPNESVGARRLAAARQLVSGVTEKANHIAAVRQFVDTAAIKALPEEDKEQWKRQLADGRLVITRILGAL